MKTSGEADFVEPGNLLPDRRTSLIIDPATVSPDGKRFLLLKDAETSGGTKPPPLEIRLVLHWVNELERLVPAK